VEVVPTSASGADWEMAPPPRRGPAAVETEAVETAVHEAHPASKTRRLYRIIMAGLLTAFLVVGGTVFYVAWTKVQSRENAIAQEAKVAYDEGRFPEAVSKYRQLAKQFPESQRVAEYQFFADLADVRAQLGSATAAPDAVLETVKGFLDVNGTNPLLKDHAREFGPEFVQWLAARYEAGAGQADLSPEFVKKAQATLEQARQLVPEAFTPEELAKVEEAFHKAEVAAAKRQKYKAVVAQLQKLKPTAEDIKKARRLIAQENREQAGFDQDPAVQAALGKLVEGQLQEVRYVAAGEAPPPRRGRAEDLEPSLVVNQLLYGVPPQRRDNDPVVLALVRGVLYALAQSNGEIVWAMRVGIDTSTLPVRVPAAGGRPEIVLALSADTETLTALNAANGDQLWKYRLSAPCLGQPVIVGPRAYVPTYDGRVHEIELARGQPIGHYELGQPLTLGGTRQERTNLVYFPADDQCVYVLDVDKRRCERILYSGHPSGSLRSAPIVVNPGGGDEGYLILAQTAGLDATQLRAFSLPIDNGQAPPAVQTRPTRGWPWFSPYHDPEKLVLVTDAGAVGLFGIRQERNQDSALFPLVNGPFQLAGGPNGDAAHPGRAQVVACQDDALWVLAHGGLQKLNLTFSPAKGPQLAVDPQWADPLPLGSPLHASQVEGHGASTTLFLVTQAANGHGCLATAVDAGSRKMLWQRELGLVCQAVPVALGQDVLALDQGGGVFAFDPARRRNDLWQPGGLSLAKPLADNPSFRPVLVPAGDGVSAYEIACPGKGTQLVVRRFQVDAAAGRVVPPQDMDEKLVDLPAPPAGAAAVRGANLLLPLEDGTLFRVQLPDCPPGTPGPEWRAGRAAGQRCHVVWINDEDFLVTDGGRGVSHFRWPLGKPWVAFPETRTAQDPTVALRRSLVAAPAPVPGAGGELVACVADLSGALTLLRGDLLQEERRWDLGGRITAGPFVRGNRVGCVVDGVRLVWLDPGQEKPVWEYRNPKGEPIVGEPQLVDGMLVVAHQSGRFVGLNPATGQRHGPGFTLQASAAPSASPVPFGTGRAFAPLTDGTVLLLDLRHLRGPLFEFPIVW
jgi:outer membrane protein assembly factor BamB